MSFEVPAQSAPAVPLQTLPIIHNPAALIDLPMRLELEELVPTRTRVTSKLSPSGENRTFTAMVFSDSGTPAGTIMFENGSKVLGAEALHHGSASIKVEADQVSGVVTAIYSGNFHHATSSNELVRIPNTAKSEPSAPMEVGVPCEVNAGRTPAELPVQASPIPPNPSGEVSSKASPGKLVSPKVLVAMKRASRKIADDKALQRARRARKHVPTGPSSPPAAGAVFLTVHDGIAQSATPECKSEDEMQAAVVAAGEGYDLEHDPPEEVALEHEIVTLLQECKKTSAIFGRSKDEVKRGKESVARVQAELDRVLWEYKRQLAKTGRNGRWTPFVRAHELARATADRWAMRHELRVNPKPVIGPDEALSGPTEKDVTALVQKVAPGLILRLPTPASVVQFLTELAAALQPYSSAS